MQSVRAIIDLKALRHNFQLIKSKVPNSKIVAVVKANAYGHGLVEVARSLSDCADAYAVARIEEGLSLRSAGIVKPIILLEGFFNESDIPVIVANNFQTAVHSEQLLEQIEHAVLPSPVKCWLKLDTGMHRLGVGPEEAESFYQRMINSPNVAEPVGLISHLCTADEPDKADYTRKQIECFTAFAAAHPDMPTALANSAGVFSWPSSHTDYVRPGIVLYGVSPYEDQTGEDLGLKPVMTLKSNLIAVKKLKKGDKVGYGISYEAPYDTVLGIVAMGYGDGYPRQTPNGTPVLVNNRLVKTAGHVCMDMMFVDLGPDAHDQPGDEVTLWGEGLPVEIISGKVGTIPYELVLKLTSRVDYVYKS
ncbi:MAG: alanine racemase [Succinivibrionaceae bacterium]